jgi:hypothetical protein
MKTLHKIFMYLSLAIGLFCVGAVCCGATHQWFFALAGLAVYGMLRAESINSRPKNMRKKAISIEDFFKGLRYTSPGTSDFKWLETSKKH